MYKCSVCNQEYEEKPDFCDCGNDEFEEIKQQKVSDEQVKSEFPKSQPDRQTIQQTIQEKNLEPKNIKSSFYDKTESETIEASRFQKFISENTPSLIIFFICIFLSILSIIFIGRDSIKTVESANKTELKAPIKDFPDINGLWTETNNKKSKETVKISLPPITVTENNKEIEKKPETKQIAQPINNVFKSAQQKNPKSSAAPVIPKTTNKTTQANATQKTINKTVKSNSPPVQQPSVQTPIQAQTQTKTSAVATPSQISSAAEKQELKKYKTALRNKIASNINFTTVVGDGYCVITFNIAKSGQLTNRSFTKLSKNESLNDAVYAGIMRTPSFYPPPSAYNNEMLKLSVKMYGDTFEVDLP